MTIPTDFDRLIEEGLAVPVAGWDFSWFLGRATEGRPPWGYQRLLAERLPGTGALLDLQTGGGEVTAGALRMSGTHPGSFTATESWEPNLALARSALAPWGARVLGCPDDEVPVPDDSIDLAVSRHPVTTPWGQIARVLRPGGTYLSQEVGSGSVRELTAAMIGPFDVNGREPELAKAQAENAGLTVVRLELASRPMTFNDIAAVIVFLRKVIWIVPDFTVGTFRPQLQALHERIVADGPFRATSERFLIECSR